MKTKLLILFGGILFLITGCESNMIPSLVGKWETLPPDPYEVTITDSLITVETISVSCKYVVLSDKKIHIERLWLSETAVDYMADCNYRLYGDTLIISDFIPEIVQVYPPKYADIKLIKSKR